MIHRSLPIPMTRCTWVMKVWFLDDILVAVSRYQTHILLN